MSHLPPLETLPPARFETALILKRVAKASRQLAELKGVSASIPNEAILINTLGLQEAKDSSAIENIVTTHDELFRDVRLPESERSPAVKEVMRYAQALKVGFDAVNAHHVLTNNHLIEIQAVLEHNTAGFRRLPGTALKNQIGEIVYTPPDPVAIVPMMTDLERFINDDAKFEADPLIKMALIHHRFEAIHPFYDGNGRTGRILNVLYLMMQGLIDIPVLYMSRHIIRTKPEYYRLLREVQTRDAWEEWVLYMLEVVEETARDGIAKVTAIKDAFLAMKHRMRAQFPRIYSQDLLNNLFSFPYTKIQFVAEDLGVSRLTAAKYLNTLAAAEFLVMRRIGRSNYYINPTLYSILTGSQRPVSQGQAVATPGEL